MLPKEPPNLLSSLAKVTSEMSQAPARPDTRLGTPQSINKAEAWTKHTGSQSLGPESDATGWPVSYRQATRKRLSPEGLGRPSLDIGVAASVSYPPLREPQQAKYVTFGSRLLLSPQPHPSRPKNRRHWTYPWRWPVPTDHPEPESKLPFNPTGESAQHMRRP